MNSISLNAFLNQYLHHQFFIPIYQRKYEWTTSKFDDLISDIQDIDNSDPNSSHFLGLFVFTEESNQNVQRLNIIDGQQRLTTLMILLNVLNDISQDVISRFPQLGNEYPGEEIYPTISNLAYIDQKKSKRIKSGIKDVYEDKILNKLTFNIKSPILEQWEKDIVKKSRIDARIEILKHKNCNINQSDLKKRPSYLMHNYIKTEILRIILDEDTDKNYKKLHKCLINSDLKESTVVIKSVYDIVAKVKDKMKLMLFKPNSDSEAFKLFEVLNDRGIAVSGIDLLKNNCLINAGDDNNKIDEVYNLWTEIFENELVSSDYVLFLRSSYNSRYEFVRKKDLFDKFSVKIKDLDYLKTTSFLSTDLYLDAKVYNYADNSKTHNDKNISNLICMLKATAARQYLPITMSILRVVDCQNTIKVTNLAKDNLELILEIIISMSFNKKPFNLIENKFPEIARSIKSFHTPIECENVLKLSKKTIKEFMDTHPKDVKYSSIYLKNIEWDNIQNNRAVLLLLLLKYKTGRNIKGSNITLEHICPQTINPQTEWDLEFPKQQRKEFIYSIGNCVLLDKKTNSSLSNKSFKDKLAIYKEYHLEDHIIDQNLEVTKQSNWLKEIIEKRQHEIFSELKNKYGFK